ncbi:MAG: histidine biosynthesis protein [Variovorax paradoxus]|nr:MAG: histidine biosynthesis protein [Variovorax paradoxus]PZQ15176.1 MAG: histidine biosynthesis protein [Variovorax paradoxus]
MARQLTLKELDQEIAKLQQQKAAIYTAERTDVIARMKEAVAYYDITAADLGLGGTGKKARTVPASVAVAEKPGRGAGRVKYKDDAGNSWSGFGPKPRWFVEALAGGKTEADLRA